MEALVLAMILLCLLGILMKVAMEVVIFFAKLGFGVFVIFVILVLLAMAGQG